MSSASSDESSSEDEKLPGRAKWLKKVVAKPAETAKPIAPKVQPTQSVQTPKEVKVTTTDAGKKVWAVEHDMKEEVLDKKLAEVIASRGRKSTDPKDVLRKLEVLAEASKKYGPKKEIPVLMHLVSAMFDAQRSIDDYMDLQQWRTCFQCLTRIIALLGSHKNIILGVMPTEDVNELVLAPMIRVKKQEDEEEVEATTDSGKGPLKVVGSLESFIARLEDEYMKSLQQINPHTQVH